MQKFKFAVIFAVLIALMTAAVSLLEEPSNYILAKDNITLFNTGDKTVVSVNNNAKFTVDGNLYASSYSSDKSKAVIYVDFRGGSRYKPDKGGKLWYVTASDKVKIAEGVERYTFSMTGGGIAYLTDVDYNNLTASLYLYDCKEKNTIKITDNAYFYGDLRLSPDGKTVGYMADYDIDTREYTAYVAQADAPAINLGRNTVCVAVSDGAKYIYYKEFNPYTDSNSFSFHVKTGNKDVELISETPAYDELYLSFNGDCSQTVFNFDGKAYISRNGRQKEKIAGYLLYGVILPKNGEEVRFYSEYGGAAIYGVKDFAETNFISLDEFEITQLVYINKKYKASKITSLGHSPFLTDDGKYIIFMDEANNLCRIKAGSSGAEKTVISKDSPVFSVSADGNLIYFVNKYDELWCVKKDQKPVKISDNVYRISLSMAGSSNKAFFITDYVPGKKSGYFQSPDKGTLYYSDNGGGKMKVDGGDSVSSVFATQTNIFYYTSPSSSSYTSYTYDVYRSDGSEKFYKFHANIIGSAR